MKSAPDHPRVTEAGGALTAAQLRQFVTGWHIDPAFDHHKPDFMDWRVNIHSRGRTLLMLFLFSDVTEADAPTRLRAGSHMDIARAIHLALGHGG